MLIWHEPEFCQRKSHPLWHKGGVPQGDFDECLGQILSGRRRNLGISQEYLATILRKDQAYVSKVETGKRTVGLFEFLRWGKALNLQPDDLRETLGRLEEHVE